MVNFGFSSLETSIIDIDNVNHSLEKEMVREEPSFNFCISCGSCAATCTAGKFNGFNFRDMCRKIRLGEVAEAFKESEKCMLCGKCTLVCPRNVNTRNILRIVRKATKN